MARGGRQQRAHRCAGHLLYCYALENVTQPYLGLSTYSRGGHEERVPDIVPDIVEDFHSNTMQSIYGPDVFDARRPNLDLGSVALTEGRMLVVPNVMMRRLEPFELIDRTRHGHLKLVTIAFVGPKVPVVNTAFVPAAGQIVGAQWGDGARERAPPPSRRAQ